MKVNADLAVALIGFKDQLLSVTMNPVMKILTVSDLVLSLKKAQSTSRSCRYHGAPARFIRLLKRKRAISGAPQAGKHQLGTFRVVMFLIQSRICLAFHGQV
jgi:hypothetical protein